MTKSDRLADHPADIADLDAKRAERPHQIVRHGLPDPFAVADPGGGEVVFFDTVLAFAQNAGIGSITLTTQQQRVDTAGAPFEERRVTAILKASLPALQHLKAVITEIERKASEEVEAAVAAANADRPSGLPN